MRTTIPEKLIAIRAAIVDDGSANVTRLTVLKKWFVPPERLVAFAVWVAGRAISRKGKTLGDAAVLFKDSKALLKDADWLRPVLDREAADNLFDRLRDFQNEYRKAHWTSVRIINNWNLFLIESALAIYLEGGQTPEEGYRLAANYCKNYDSRYGDTLNGPSIAKINEIVRFMYRVEALEDER